METLNSADSLQIHQTPSNYDDIPMEPSLCFADSLKDLKNLRTQLYSAAKYFEVSYTNDDSKQSVVATLKDYAVKALVNTVDHLGSVTYKVNNIIDENVEEVSGTEFCVSCIEQRLRTCQEYVDQEGMSQQSSVINTPRYDKHYILPAGENTNNAHEHPKFQGNNLRDVDDYYQLRTAVCTTMREAPVPSSRKGSSVSPTVRPSRLPASTSSLSASTTPKKEIDRRSVSPDRFPLMRSGSLATRPASKPASRPTTPTRGVEWQERFPRAPQRSTSVHVHSVREIEKQKKELQRTPGKSKGLLKKLLSRRKSKVDDMLYTYLDEY